MEFPRLVFKCPGQELRPGGTYAHALVASEDARAERLADGWFDSLPEAVDALNKPAAAVVMATLPVQDDDTPPTRAEMEAKAAEVGITIDKRWGDARLMAEIEKKLAP